MNILKKIKELEERLEDMTIIDSEDILAVETGLGTELRFQDPPDDTEEVTNEYNGMFKVVAYQDEEVIKYKVINGQDPESDYCGYVQLAGSTNSFTLPVAVLSGMTTPRCYLVTKKDSENLGHYIAEIRHYDGSIALAQEDWIQLADWNSDGNGVLQIWDKGSHLINYRWV